MNSNVKNEMPSGSTRCSSGGSSVTPRSAPAMTTRAPEHETEEVVDDDEAEHHRGVRRAPARVERVAREEEDRDAMACRDGPEERPRDREEQQVLDAVEEHRRLPSG